MTVEPNLALFWTYDREAPSFRHRLAPVMPALQRLGWRSETVVLPRGRYLTRILSQRSLLRRSAILVLAKIKLSPFEAWLLRRIAKTIVFDYDDAIYYRRPRWPGQEPDRSWWRRTKFAATCRITDLVLAGNSILADHASPFADRVAVLPTPVDAESYPPVAPASRNGRTLVWIGLPENLPYLELARPALTALVREYPDLRLRIVSSDFPRWPEIPMERVTWSEKTEVQALSTADIGLMPLTDDDWTRGKCAFKLLQYMAASLPCVASPVGVNREIVLEGKTGFLASTPDQWTDSLRLLLDSPSLRAELGEHGRRRVLADYDQRILASRVADQLHALV